MTKDTLSPKKKGPIPVKKSKRKPKDKPKRPLSAYNYFFKEERVKILKAVLEGDGTGATDPEMDEEMMKKLKKEGGKVSFEEMGKLIGQRWKDISEERLAHYTSLAQSDTDRYKKEMEAWNGRREEMRNESRDLRPDQMYPMPPHVQGAHGRGPMPPMHLYPDPSLGGPSMYGQYMPYNMDPNAPPGYGQPMMPGYPPYSYPPPAEASQYSAATSSSGNGNVGNNTSSKPVQSPPSGGYPVSGMPYG